MTVSADRPWGEYGTDGNNETYGKANKFPVFRYFRLFRIFVLASGIVLALSHHATVEDI